jgi:hypothetical protein
MDPDPDLGGPKHVDPDLDSDLQHWYLDTEYQYEIVTDFAGSGYCLCRLTV